MIHNLYVVAVPIGNLKEITILGKEKLSTVKTIFCEDTRVTSKLLNCLDINNQQELLSINQFNESEKTDLIYQKLEKHECALVSDAGYPVISDPGYFLIKKLRSLQAPIQVINGPCAFIHAIVTSGIDSRKIFWANFLSKKEFKRKKELEKLIPINKEATIVFYEASKFIIRGLKIIRDVFGEIKVGVARELSKINETFYFDTPTNLIKNLTIKGEFVVLIPKNDDVSETTSLVEILHKIHLLVTEKNLTIKDSIKVYKNDEFGSSDLYKAYIERYKSTQ